MSLDVKNLTVLMKTVARANPTAPVAYSFGEEKFSYDELNETLRSELKEIAGDYRLYEDNKRTIFRLIEDTIDDVLPRRVIELYGQFADTKVVAQGDKPVFTQKITEAARRRARQFVTKVGLAGRYEVFKLDGRSYTVPTSAFGGAAQIGFEEFLDGRVDFAEVTNIIMEGLDRAIYLEIERALTAAISSLQPANKTTQTSFVESEMDRLIGIVESYGTATIYCTYEFAATMVPETGWISDNMRDQKWNNGYLANYKGHRVIVLPNSYEDETNTKKVIDSSNAWIIPTGAEKPVKVVLEGQTLVREAENEDWSREIQVYKKLGAAAIIQNNICVYTNTSLEG